MAMSGNESMKLLVGDNPFHGISHLSQERSRNRADSVQQSKYAAGLVVTALENGADGFMFSVSETTLSILREIRKRRDIQCPKLYAIVPYAYEYVRLATQVGGIPGLAKRVAKDILLSMNLRAIGNGVKGVFTIDPKALMKTYIFYEISRIKSAVGKNSNLTSLILHEIVTEMALAFDLDWFFKDYIDFVSKLGIKPGFESRNFAFLVEKFSSWGIDWRKILVTVPFNKIGFQMNPSKKECERALKIVPGLEIIAISVLAAGYLKPKEAIEYVKTLPNISGVVAGVSKEKHAKETFKIFKSIS
jgi:uncharacterized protein (DUF486 family)